MKPIGFHKQGCKCVHCAPKGDHSTNSKKRSKRALKRGGKFSEKIRIEKEINED